MYLRVYASDIKSVYMQLTHARARANKSARFNFISPLFVCIEKRQNKNPRNYTPRWTDKMHKIILCNTIRGRRGARERSYASRSGSCSVQLVLTKLLYGAVTTSNIAHNMRYTRLHKVKWFNRSPPDVVTLLLSCWRETWTRDVWLIFYWVTKTKTFC